MQKSSSESAGPGKEGKMKHHLFIGTWTPPGAIFTVSFDEATRNLELVKRTDIPQDQPISWLTLSHDRNNIYGAGMKKWGSYHVNSPTDISLTTSLSIGGDARANSNDTNTRAIFVLAAQKEPYFVYANPFYNYSNYINVFSVDETGALKENVQNVQLDDVSQVHGMVFDQQEDYLYSADMYGDQIWTHKKDPQTGHLTLIGKTPAPAHGDHPRWVEISRSGKYLYALMEAGNRLSQYAIDPTTHLPTYTHASYPLIPPDFSTYHPSTYRSDVTFTSASGAYLFATSRSADPRLTGYIAAFQLSRDGRIARQLALNPTPTGGGHSNAVAPSPWTDEWLALTDDQEGWVEMYRWKDELLGRVAHLDVQEPGFGMNAAWYD